MAGSVYSHRLALHTGSIGATGFTVPAGKVAVVKWVTFYNPGTTQGTGSVVLAGFGIAAWSVPGANGSISQEFFLPCTAGEVVQVYCSRSDMTGTISGYLFSDV